MSAQPLGQMIIELGLDSGNFSRGMKGINQQIKTSMTEMKAHLNVMGQSGSEIDKLKAKQTGLTGVIAAQNNKVALAKEKYDACKAAVEGNAEATQQQRDALIRAQNEYVRAIGELGSYENQLQQVQIRLTAMESSIYKTGEAMVKLGQRMTRVGDITTKVGKTMVAGITTPLVALGTASVKVASDFESAMSQVQATMGLTKDSMSTLDGQTVNTMDSLGELAKRMGAETKFSAMEAAAAINNMAMAGYDTQQIYETLPNVLNLAAAGALDLDYATQLAANGLNVMGLKTSDLGELSDKLAVTASSAYGSVADFGEGLLRAGAQASIANVNLTDTLTALGILGDAGISASDGGTMLRNVIKNLYTPTKVAREALEELGVSTADSDGTLRELQDVLQDLDGALAGLSDDEKVKAMSKIFDTRTIAGANALLEASGERFDELAAKIEESGGAAQAMTDTQLDNLGGQLTILKSATEGIAISFGEIMLPAVKSVTSGLQGLADWMNNLDEKQKQTIVRVASVAAVMGPLVLVVGKLTSGIGPMITGIGNGLKKFAEFDAKLKVTTGLTTAQTVAAKAQAAAEAAKNVVIAAGNGTLAAQAAALNASIAAKIKGTAATAAHTVAETARNLILGASTANLSAQAVATGIQTVATGALSVATGVLTTAITILLGPIGLIIAGIGLLVAGVIAAVKWFTKETEAAKQMKEETEALSEANDALVESLGSSQSSYDENVKSINAEAGAAKALADKVTELSKVENKSARQKQELQSYVNMLNSSVEGLNLQYDAQADSLSASTTEIYSQISAMEEQAKAQAAQERLTEILKEQMLVNEQLTQVQNKVTEATGNTALKESERKTILADLATQEAALNEQLTSLGDSYAYVTDIIVESTVVETAAVTENTQTILEAYGTIKSAYEDMGKVQQDAVDGVLATYETMTGKLSDLTEKIKLDNKTTWAQIQKNQEDTIAKTKEFSELYAQLIEAGVSESYLNAIGATGPESIPLLKQMLSQGTDAVLASQDEWQEAYSVIGDTLVDSLKLDDTVSDALKDYVLGESGVYGTLQGAINDADLNALGKSLTDGVSKGILENTDSLTSSATDMADATTGAAQDAWDINSPSKVFAEMGKFLMQGLVQGMTNNESAVYAKATEIANNVTKTVKDALDIHSPSRIMRDQVGKNIALGIAEGISQNKDYAKKSVEEVADAIVKTAKEKLDNTKVYQELTLADEAAYWNSVRKQVKEGTQARIDADKQYFQAKKSLDQKMLDHEKNYTTKSKKLYEDLDKNIKSLQDSYTDKLASRAKSIADSMGLFDEFTAKTELTTKELLSNLKSQVTGLQDWSSNLRALEKRGVSSELMEELRGMGTSAAGEIALLTELTDEELSEYVSLWKQKQRLAKKEATKELAPLLDETEAQISQMRIAAANELEEYKQEFVDAMSEIGAQIQKPLDQIQTSMLDTMSQAVQMAAGTVSDESDKQANVSRFQELAASVFRASEGLPSEFASLGQNTVDGLIQGLQSRSGALFEAMSGIVRGAIQTAKDEAQIHSPSRVMMSLGSYMIEGFGVGMEQMQDYAEGIAGDSAAAVSHAFRSGLEDNYLINNQTRMPVLNLDDSMGAIQSIGRALEATEPARRAETANHENSNYKILMEALINSNNQVVKLLQVIADKNLVIDKSSLTNAVDTELGNIQTLRVREA